MESKFHEWLILEYALRRRIMDALDKYSPSWAVARDKWEYIKKIKEVYETLVIKTEREETK